MTGDVEGDWDGQDQSEVFDEDNQNPDAAGGAGNEMRTFEELPDVIDVTQAAGDEDDDEAAIAEELDDEEIVQMESDATMADFEDDDLAGRMGEELEESEGSAQASGAADEVELEYAGDMDDVTVAEADAADEMAAENLADDDLEDLGYPGEDEPAQHSEEAEAQRRR